MTENNSRETASFTEFQEGRFIVGFILAFISLFFFWYFRAAEMSGGDSDQWCREIEAGVWFRKRQMFSFAAMQLTYTITHSYLNWNGRWAINASSCMAGACFVFLVWRLLGVGRLRWVSLGFVFSAGFMQLFFGHVETYAFPMTCLLFFLLIYRRYLAGRVRAIHVAAAFSLGIAFHMIFWFVLPIFGILLLHSRRRRRDAVEVAAGLLPAVLFTALVWVSPRYGFGEMVGDRFMPLFQVVPGTNKRFALFSWNHFYHWLWFAWNTSHFTLPIVFLAFIFRWLKRNPWTDMLAALAGCFLIFTFIWHPDAGRLDWDLFSFTGLPMVLLAVEAVREWRGRWSTVFVWGVISISAALLGVKVVDAARLGTRGEGVVRIRFEPDNRAETWVITLDGHAKETEIRHVLEGRHKVMVYQSDGRNMFKYIESFDIEPGEAHEVIVPATPPIAGAIQYSDH
ncbi:MAG: hypothetical protein ABIH23_35405 [bacterium]